MKKTLLTLTGILTFSLCALADPDYTLSDINAARRAAQVGPNQIIPEPPGFNPNARSLEDYSDPAGASVRHWKQYLDNQAKNAVVQKETVQDRLDDLETKIDSLQDTLDELTQKVDDQD